MIPGLVGTERIQRMNQSILTIQSEIEKLLKENNEVRMKSGEMGFFDNNEKEVFVKAWGLLQTLKEEFQAGLTSMKNEPEVMAKYRALITKKAQSKKP